MIGTWLNDLLGEKAKDLFLNKQLLSNVSFQLSDKSTIYGHKALISARCDVMKRKFLTKSDNVKLEGTPSILCREQMLLLVQEATIPPITRAFSVLTKVLGTTKTPFLAFLDFLYTDHVPYDADTIMEFIELGNRFGVSRLVTLCELFVTKVNLTFSTAS